MTSKGPVATGPKQAAENPDIMDCQGASTLPSPSSLPKNRPSKLFFAQNRHIWLVPLRITVGAAPDQSPKSPSSLKMVVAACTGPCTGSLSGLPHPLQVTQPAIRL